MHPLVVGRLPASGGEVKGLLGRKRISPSSGSATSDRLTADAQYCKDINAMRAPNDFITEKRSETLCYLTGSAWPSGDLQKAHLVPNSEYRVCDLTDGLRMLGTVPNISELRNRFKVAHQNSLPMQTMLHSRFNAMLPGLLLAPSNEELISIITTIETCLAAAEEIVSRQKHTRFSINFDRVLAVTAKGSIIEGADVVEGLDPGLRLREIELCMRLPLDEPYSSWRYPLHSLRQQSGITAHEPDRSNVFPASYEPPLPKLLTCLNITNVTILFLNALRDLRAGGVLPSLPEEMQEKMALPSLSEEMQEKECLAIYYVSLACSDTLVSWRDLPRPATLPAPAPPASSPSNAHLVERSWFPANPRPVTRSRRVRAATANGRSSSDAPEVDERLLRLGQSGDQRASLPSASDDEFASLPAASDDECISAFDSDASNASTEDTSFKSSRDQEDVTIAEHMKKCEGCVADRARCEQIESELLPEAQNEIRKIFAERVRLVGTGRALQEVFFRPEGLEFYGGIRAKLGELADELDELNEEAHTCLRESIG